MSNLLLQMNQAVRKSIWNQAAGYYMLYEDPILTEIKIPKAKNTKLYFLRFFAFSWYQNTQIAQHSKQHLLCVLKRRLYEVVRTLGVPQTNTDSCNLMG